MFLLNRRKKNQQIHLLQANAPNLTFCLLFRFSCNFQTYNKRAPKIMASVQERLQLKRVPLENWSVSEQLYLASAVACSGDQNWMSVSRNLKMMCGNNRPSDWFSQKSCAAQYEMLLENVETPKRKKRNEKDTSQAVVETPTELIVRKLTQERIAELKKLIQEERDEYNKIKDEINSIESGSFDENQLRDMWMQIEAEERQREKEKAKYAQWLKVGFCLLTLTSMYIFLNYNVNKFYSISCRNVRKRNVKWSERFERMHTLAIKVHQMFIRQQLLST